MNTQTKLPSDNLQTYLSKEYILSHVYPRIDNQKKSDMFSSKGILTVFSSDCPNLILSYHTRIPTPDTEYQYVTVTEKLLHFSKLKMSDIITHAMENMEHDICIKSMFNFLSPIAKLPNLPDDPSKKVLIMTNKSMTLGASIILSHKAMDKTAGMLQCTDLLLIPSSIHEILALPYPDEPKTALPELRKILIGVNHTIDPEDVLSDILYSFKNGSIQPIRPL